MFLCVKMSSRPIIPLNTGVLHHAPNISSSAKPTVSDVTKFPWALLKRNWGSLPCRGWGMPPCRVWSQPPPAYSHNSHTWDSPRARKGPAPLARPCNTIEMNAEHCGAGSSQMVLEWHQVTWYLTVWISLVTVGKPHLTVLVMSVGWKWTRNGVCFTALRFNSISVGTKWSKSGSTIL